MIVALIDEAVLAGARRDLACKELGLCGRTVGRWRGHGGGKDGRGEAGGSPAHKLTDVEKATIVALARVSRAVTASDRAVARGQGRLRRVRVELLPGASRT